MDMVDIADKTVCGFDRLLFTNLICGGASEKYIRILLQTNYELLLQRNKRNRWRIVVRSII